VLTVFDWAAEVAEQYLSEIRPAFGRSDHPAVFLTERGTRISPSSSTRLTMIALPFGPRGALAWSFIRFPPWIWGFDTASLQGGPDEQRA
jgi:hypothetical protein